MNKIMGTTTPFKATVSPEPTFSVFENLEPLKTCIFHYENKISCLGGVKNNFLTFLMTPKLTNSPIFIKIQDKRFAGY